MKIRIDVPVYNRKNITELCLMQLQKTKHADDQIYIYNDGSTEYNNEWLMQFGTVVNYKMPEQDRWRNIHTIRSLAYRDFVDQDFDLLYMTDNDAFHDPNWRKKMVDIFLSANLPVSGYVSNYMFQNYLYYKNQLEVTNSTNTLGNKFKVITSTGGGISILLDKNRVRQILTRIGNNNISDMWDCFTWNVFNNRYAVSSISLLEHFGKGGLHHTSWDHERAVYPSLYLQTIRPIVIDYLENKISKDEVIQKI